MSRTTRVGLLAGAAALTLTGVGNARPAAGDENLAQRLAAAEAKIAAMEAAQNQSWLTEQRASEIRGLVQDVLADADTRASLLQAGMTAGYDQGAVLGSSDGNWLLRTNILLQTRFIWNWREDDDTGLIDSHRYGFETTRAKFMMSGHVVNPDWYYRIDANIGVNGENRVGMLNGYLGHDYGNGWKIQMGTMKLPLLREELVEAQNQLAVERSIVNYLFTGGYADGLQIMYQGEQFGLAAMLSDGLGTGNTIWSTEDTEYALTGRVEFLASGTWEQFQDFTSERGGQNGVLIGGAIHYQDGEYGTPSIETETLILTGDISAEFGNANLFASLVWVDTDTPGVGGSPNPWGVTVQGGVYLNASWELFGRYEHIDFDVTGADDVNVITVGVNKYFSGHNAKWTTDLAYAFDSMAAAPNITGFLPDLGGEDGQLVLRTQWQILF